MALYLCECIIKTENQIPATENRITVIQKSVYGFLLLAEAVAGLNKVEVKYA